MPWSLARALKIKGDTVLRTKTAKKLLTKKEQRHLTDMKIYSMATFERTRALQILQVEENPNIEPCFECKFIAQKLGIK